MSGVENDAESSLRDIPTCWFGVRKPRQVGMQAYDEFTGRFFQIDPNVVGVKRRSRWLSGEKYYRWTPYHYSVNNPVSFLDGNGFEYYVSINGTMDDERPVINEDDPTVYLVEEDEDGNETITSIGQMGNVINVTKIVDYLFKKNIEEAEEMSIFEFVSKVQPVGDWDYKASQESIFSVSREPKSTYIYDFDSSEFGFYSMESQDFGNLHFGVVAKAQGLLSEGMWLLGGGIVQILSGRSKWEWLLHGGDDPRDIIWIEKGFDHFNSIKN